MSAGSCSGDAGNVNRWGDARRNFDFLIGTRDVRKSRLRECLKGSDRWDDFEARSVSRHVLGGLGSIDRIAFGRSFMGQEAMTLRSFDPAAREWGLHWADSSTSKIFTRLVGSFTEGRGVFSSAAISGRISPPAAVGGSRHSRMTPAPPWRRAGRCRSHARARTSRSRTGRQIA